MVLERSSTCGNTGEAANIGEYNLLLEFCVRPNNCLAIVLQNYSCFPFARKGAALRLGRVSVRTTELQIPRVWALDVRCAVSVEKWVKYLWLVWQSGQIDLLIWLRDGRIDLLIWPSWSQLT